MQDTMELENATDGQLVARFRAQGCPASIQTLLERYEQPIYHFLRSMLGNKEDAEDATQRCFVQAIHALPGYEEQGQFKSWLYQIARSQALMQVRRRKRKPEELLPSERLDDLLIAQEPSVYEKIDREEQVAALQRAIEQLPDAQKEVVLLRLQADIPFREIAEILDTPLNTVLGRMRDATQKLRTHLSNKYPV